MALTYPEDRTGVLASNKITNEIHTITAQNNRNFHFFIPKFAPFYEEGVKLFKNINSTQLELVEGRDYHFVYKFESASLSTMKQVFGGIAFMDLTLNGELALEYQTVGGNWTLDEQKILEIVANETYNPRGRTWDQTTGKPEVFGPTSHIQDASDFLTDEQVGEKLDEIAEAIAQNTRPLNTTPVTLEQLGIPKIGNWGMATLEEAVAGLSSDTLINPLTLKAVLDKLGLTNASQDLKNFRDHINNKNNPHESDKETVDLGKVENRGMAPEEKVLAGQDDDGLVSLTTLRAYLRMHGCQTAPEDAQKYKEKGAILSYRCTSNYDRIGIFADGMGHTYENIVEPNSPECGYRPPAANNYPAHGTVLQYYCLDFDRWKIVADGYGNSYHAFVMANSGDCGYDGGGTVTKPPAGTLLSAYCDGTILVQTLANGQGGSYENRVPGHPDCAGNVQHPPRGNLVSTFCENQNEVGKYTDGAGGFYDQVIVQNSLKCGYTTITTASPITNPPYGTPMGNGCEGVNYVNKFANGNGGTYSEIIETNSSRCGYQQPTTTTTTTQTPTVPASLDYQSTLSYITPQSNVAERHTVTLRNGRANTTYRLRGYIRGQAGVETMTVNDTFVTNTTGTGTWQVERGIWGKDPLAAFVPDDTYQCWFIATIESNGAEQVRSNTKVRTYSGFGSSPGANMTLRYTPNPNFVQIGTRQTHTLDITGGVPGASYSVSVMLRYLSRPGFLTKPTYTTTMTCDSSGVAQHILTPAMQGNPNGVTGPSGIVPDGVYGSWIEANGLRSPEVNITWQTGSTLRIEDSFLSPTWQG